MNRHSISTIALTAALSVTGIVSAPGQADAVSSWLVRYEHNKTRNLISQEAGDTREAVIESIETQTDDLNVNMDDNTSLIIEALKGQARENSNHMQMQVEANQRIEDAAQVNAVNRVKDEFRARAESGEFDPSPSACLLVDLFGGTSNSTLTNSGNGSAVSTEVSKWTNGDDPIVKNGGAELSKHILDKSKEYEDFMGSKHATTDQGLLDEPTVDYSDPAMAEVAKIITRNNVNSTPPAAATDGELLTTAGIDRHAALQEYNARMSTALSSKEFVMNLNSAVMDDPKAVADLKKFKDQSHYNRDVGDKVSEMQQIDIRTVWNYAPKGERLAELKNSSSMSERAWLSEIHDILSINTRIAYLQLELMSRDAQVNSSILSTLNDPTGFGVAANRD